MLLDKTTPVTTDSRGDDPPPFYYQDDFAYVAHENAVILTLDLSAKAAEVKAIGGSYVVIGKGEFTIKLDNPNSDGFLQINFPAYKKGWSCLHAFVSRYTLYVVFVPDESTEGAGQAELTVSDGKGEE